MDPVVADKGYIRAEGVVYLQEGLNIPVFSHARAEVLFMDVSFRAQNIFILILSMGMKPYKTGLFDGPLKLVKHL